MRVVLGLSLMAFVVACSKATQGSGRDRSVILAGEIATVQAASAYDIVAKLRSEFLRSRGPITTSRGRATTPPVIMVFVDGVEAGPVDGTLHHIPAAQVHEIRLLKATDAVTKYGSRHNGGVIEVLTTKTPRQ
jgi:outer membrane cobalamin receptor